MQILANRHGVGLLLTAWSLLMLIVSPLQANAVLTLESAIDRALSQSVVIQAEQAGLNAVRAREKQAGYLHNPEIEYNLQNFSGSGGYAGRQSVETTFMMKQLIELGGQHHASKENAARLSDITELEFRLAQQKLIRDVSTAYFEVLYRKARFDLMREEEARLQRMVRDMKKRVRSGSEHRSRLLQVEVEYHQQQLASRKAEADLHEKNQRLASFWNMSTLFGIPESSRFLLTEGPDSLDDYRSVFQSGAIMKLSAAHLARKKAALKLEKTRAIPDAAFSVGLRRFSATDDEALVAGVTTDFPLWNRNQGHISAARSEMIQASKKQALVGRNLDIELEKLWNSWRLAGEEAVNYKNKLLPASEESLKLAERAYRAGRFSYRDVRDAQRHYAATYERYYQSLMAHHRARAGLLYLVYQVE